MKKERKAKAQVSPEVKAQFVERFNKGESATDLAKEAKVHVQTIYNWAGTAAIGDKPTVRIVNKKVIKKSKVTKKAKAKKKTAIKTETSTFKPKKRKSFLKTAQGIQIVVLRSNPELERRFNEDNTSLNILELSQLYGNYDKNLKLIENILYKGKSPNL